MAKVKKTTTKEQNKKKIIQSTGVDSGKSNIVPASGLAQKIARAAQKSQLKKKERPVVVEVLPSKSSPAPKKQQGAVENIEKNAIEIDHGPEGEFDLDHDDHEMMLESPGASDSQSVMKHQDLFLEKKSSNHSIIPSSGMIPKTTSTDPLVTYLKQIARYDLLSPEQEAELTKQLHETGDIEVAKKLVLANLRLVVKIALEYRRVYHNLMDLVQEGNLGLMKAVSKYDPGKGAKLSYYASWWIRSYILKFILDNFRLVKIGTTNEQKKLFYNLMKEKQRLMAMGMDPSIKLLSENLGVSEKSVQIMDERLAFGGQDLSLDAPVGGNEGGAKINIGDLFAANEENIDAKLAHLEGLDILQKHLGEYLKGLKNERDQEIFQKRILAEIPASLQEIADQYGVSRERIRQVEERLLRNLRVYMTQFLG